MTIERPMLLPRREIETIEHTPIQDAFCTALARVENIGPCRRLVFTVPDSSPLPGDAMAVVMAKLVVPAEVLPAIAAALLEHAPAAAGTVLADIFNATGTAVN